MPIFNEWSNIVMTIFNVWRSRALTGSKWRWSSRFNWKLHSAQAINLGNRVAACPSDHYYNNQRASILLTITISVIGDRHTTLTRIIMSRNDVECYSIRWN